MKHILKKIPARIIDLYRCSRCKSDYKSKKEALQCEKMSVEPKMFRLGERVRWIEQKYCQTRQKYYWVDGKVVKIMGPRLPDEEYNAKWLGGALSGKHVFMYEVAWKCPWCKQDWGGHFYGMELKKNAG